MREVSTALRNTPAVRHSSVDPRYATFWRHAPGYPQTGRRPDGHGRTSVELRRGDEAATPLISAAMCSRRGTG